MHDDNTIIFFSIDRRWIRQFVVVAVTLAVAIPTAAWAGHQFNDVPDDNSANGIFHDDIEWMKDNGVTVGCNPNDNPPNTEYCPEEPVLRRQMAAFLHRMDTNDVFATPDEVDAMTHFAVIEGDDGSTIASNGFEGATRDAKGVYTLDFGTDISNCSWSGAVGQRDGTVLAGLILTLDADPALDPERIHASVWNEANSQTVDADFNVTINC